MTKTRSLHFVTLLAFVAALVVVLPQARAGSARQVVLVNEAFKCGRYAQPLDLDLVKVTLTAGYKRIFTHAVALRGRCSGRIGRLEVDTSIGSGVMIGKGARQLTVEGGHVRCHGRRLAPKRRGDLHQDGVIAMGGTDVTLQNLVVDCPSANNAALFFTRGRGGTKRPTEGDWPTRVVCDSCTLSAPGSVVANMSSIDSGVRNSLFACKPRLFRVRTGIAVQPVNENNRLVSREPCARIDVSDEARPDAKPGTERAVKDKTEGKQHKRSSGGPKTSRKR